MTKILVSVGSGGVGKTTVSAALALQLAQKGHRTLVITIDPSRRLATTLGLTTTDSGSLKVPRLSDSVPFFAGLIDAENGFKNFIEAHVRHPEKRERIYKNTLYKVLSKKLSGSQEFTALDRLRREVQSQEYDFIILDTPPAQHAIDFLRAPRRLSSLFQKSITQWFVGDGEGAGFVRRVLNRGTKTVFSALKLVTGKEFVDQLSLFFSGMQEIQEDVRATMQESDEILHSSHTQFLLVTGLDPAKLSEAERIYDTLQAERYNLSAVIINRAYPKWVKGEEVALATSALHQQIKEYYLKKESNLQNFDKSLLISKAVVKIPEMSEDICGLEDLQKFSELLMSSLAEVKNDLF